MNFTNKLPKILFRIDRKGEVKLFINFLNHPEFPQHRRLILDAFPELKLALDSSKEEKKNVIKFINNFYKNHKTDISLIIKDCRKEIKSFPQAIKALSEAMNYKWKKSINYIVIPTIIPFSPFGKNIFRFSILARVMKTGNKSILSTAVHEISHFIFFDLLEKIEKKENFSLPADAKFYLRETLTTALFNEEPIKSVLNLNEYKGNPEIRDVYITSSDGTTKSFIDYTRDQYTKNKLNNNNFNFFLTNFVISINNVASEFSKKRKLWNQWGKEMPKNQSILFEYQTPIKL
jgi:hypothetical protein